VSIQCDCSVTNEFDANRVEIETIRKARKPHACCECGEVIAVEKLYEEASGIDHDGYPFRFRTCLYCVAIRKHYCPRGWLWGFLAETIMDCLGFDYRLPASEIPADPAEGP